ncbi:MAG: energy-coupling factor transporter ATPase [Eubacteriales bacterium]|nr:energy-coupling factor transporter ATPase [Eubacteriales bacterium]
MGLALKNISYQYKDQGNENKYALQKVSFSMEKGEYVALIGHTGSGKSTLTQHLNGLLRPTSGQYFFDGEDVYGEHFSMKMLRQKVALCFQYPEYQLFEETVLRDIAFGPANMGYGKEESEKKARDAMKLVGLSPELERAAPFALSGGQKRRVALAGILSMEPDYLILDEPVAGLDGAGKEQLFGLLEHLRRENNLGILLVSHDMDDVASYADRVLVMSEGRLVMDGKKEEVFSREEMLREMGLDVPHSVHFYHKLREREYFRENKDGLPMTAEALAQDIAEEWHDSRHDVGTIL